MARVRSLAIMVRLGFQRSTKTPAMGPKRARGSMYEMVTPVICAGVPWSRNETMLITAKMARKSPAMLTSCADPQAADSGDGEHLREMYRVAGVVCHERVGVAIKKALSERHRSTKQLCRPRGGRRVTCSPPSERPVTVIQPSTSSTQKRSQIPSRDRRSVARMTPARRRWWPAPWHSPRAMAHSLQLEKLLYGRGILALHTAGVEANIAERFPSRAGRRRGCGFEARDSEETPLEIDEFLAERANSRVLRGARSASHALGEGLIFGGIFARNEDSLRGESVPEGDFREDAVLPASVRGPVEGSRWQRWQSPEMEWPWWGFLLGEGVESPS